MEKEYFEINGMSFDKRTCPLAAQTLANLYPRQKRVRIFLGNTETGEAWTEEHDVCGYIGRSTGSVKIPLLVHNSNSTGGGAILDHCIVRIQETKKPHRVLYSHLNFTTGTWSIEVIAQDEVCAYDKDKKTWGELGYTHRVLHNGEEYGNVKSLRSALRLKTFMEGK